MKYNLILTAALLSTAALTSSTTVRAEAALETPSPTNEDNDSQPKLNTSQTVTILYDRAALLHLCPKAPLPGCADQIEIGGHKYLVDALDPAQDTFKNIVETYRRYNVQDSSKGEVVGFLVKENGHFPNPMVNFNVFKLMSLKSFVLPKDVPAGH